MAEKKEKIVKTEKKATANATPARAAQYDILRRPIISEKAAKLAETNGMAFEVDARATKKDIANAIKAIYNVAPKSVNIVITKGKTKTFRGKAKGTTKSIKKAYVTLPKDAKIEIAAAA
ncbi:MAG: 50S ribosomal protein L23 [Proteobacteria bacterium]|nr:50S ribosomal protein L23 [Pseudomonadota bacterium]